MTTACIRIRSRVSSTMPKRRQLQTRSSNSSTSTTTQLSSTMRRTARTREERALSPIVQSQHRRLKLERRVISRIEVTYHQQQKRRNLASKKPLDSALVNLPTYSLQSSSSKNHRENRKFSVNSRSTSQSPASYLVIMMSRSLQLSKNTT